MSIVTPAISTLVGDTFSFDFGSSVAFDSVTYTDSGSTGVLVIVLVNEHIGPGGIPYAYSYAGYAHTVGGAAYVAVGPFTDPPLDQPVTPDTYGQGWLVPHAKRRLVNVRIVGGSPPYGSVSFGYGEPVPPTPAPVLNPEPTDAANPAIMAAGLSASWVGPIPYSGMLYVIQVDDSQRVWIYKFSVTGQDWANVGGACPIVGGWGGALYAGATPWWDGDHTITLAAMTSSGNANLVDFDLGSETWGAVYGTSGAPSLRGVYALYKRPDGSLLLIGENDGGANVLPAYVYSGGVWGSPLDVAANVVALGYVQPSGYNYQNTNPPKSCMDAAGNVYVFFQAKGPSTFPNSTGAGPDSAWYGRAFYQRIATDNSTPAGTGNFLDFPGQDAVVDAGGTFPTFKDGDLAWNTHKGSLLGFSYLNNGGDCFGKPTFIGSKIVVPIRRKIPGSAGFYSPNTDEQLNTYCTLLVGDSLPTPTFTEVAQGVEPGVATTSPNKCDAVGRAFYDPGTSVLSVVYLYSTLATPDTYATNNTALQRAVRLCQCQDATGSPETWVWKSVTIYDIDNPPVLPAPFGMDAISNVTFALYGSTVIVIADVLFIFGCGSLTGSGVHVFLGLGLGPIDAVRDLFPVPVPLIVTFKLYAKGSRLEWLACGSDQRQDYQQAVISSPMHPSIGGGE